MKPHPLAAAILAAAATAASASAPADPAQRPLIATYDAAAVTQRCEEGIAHAKALIAAMEAMANLVRAAR